MLLADEIRPLDCGVIRSVVRSDSGGQRGEVVLRRAVLVVLATTLATVGSSTASALRPERVEDVHWDGTVTELDPFLSDVCGFEVFATSFGHIRGTVYFNQDGSFKRFVGHPSYSTVLSSEWATIETADRGVDKFTENADGTVTVHGTGIHFKLKGEAYAIGLWRITFDGQTGETVAAEYYGNFGLEEPDILPFICDRLGAPA
jgi:hypothetical protein